MWNDRKETIEWCDVWIPHMDRDDAPRVMLIGDSIVRGYYADVERQLDGRAVCARLSTSKALGDPALLDQVRVFLAEARWDVVQVNIGMHGWTYSEAEYGAALPALHETIRAAEVDRLVWASTTPVRRDAPGGATQQRIKARNEQARRFFADHDVVINDLFTLMEPRPELHTDDVHFDETGNAVLGAQVADVVTAQLSAAHADAER